MDDAVEILKHEFEAGEGSFLLQLRCDLRWDESAFSRLAAAMLGYVCTRRSQDPIPRWIAEGFWYLDFFVKEWSSHENFPRPSAPRYYEKATKRLHDLAFWLFMGQSPYEEGRGFEPL
jgi:hypothetical protein